MYLGSLKPRDLLARIHFIEMELATLKELVEKMEEPLIPLKKKKTSDVVYTKAIETNKKIQDYKTMPYAEYLKTDHWQARRKKALGRARCKCELCGTKDETLDVHHKSYDRLGKEWKSDLIVLCRTCHSKFHDKLGHAEM